MEGIDKRRGWTHNKRNGSEGFVFSVRFPLKIVPVPALILENLKMKKILFFFLAFAVIFPSVSTKSYSADFRTPDDWTSLETVNAWTLPRSHSSRLKTSAEKEFLLLDASDLAQTPDFSNIQTNVPGIDVKTVENRTFLFTLDIEGTEGSPINVYLEGRNSAGNFLAIHLKRGDRISGTLNGKRQKMFFLAFIPKGVQELHWRFDFFKAGVFKLYGVNARFIPEQDPTEEMKRKPELIFYVSFDGNTEPEFAAGEKKAICSQNIDFVDGIRGQAASFTRKRNPILKYALEKNLNPERGSISVWVKRAPSDASWRTMLTTPWTTDTRIGSGALWFWIWCGKFRCDTSDVMDQSILSPLPNYGDWDHLVFTWNSFRMRAYVNGKPVAGEIPPDKRLEPFVPFLYDRIHYSEFHVGNYLGNALDGALDELKIFSAPLSEQEVLELYREFRPLTVSLDELYFFDGETFRASGKIRNADSKSRSVKLNIANENEEILQSQEITVSGGETAFAFPPARFPAGNYSLIVDENGRRDGAIGFHVFSSKKFNFDDGKPRRNQANAEPDEKTDERPNEKSDERPDERLNLTLIEDVPIFEAGPERLAVVGRLSVGELNGKKYLEAGPNEHERFAIRLPKMKPDGLYCLEWEFPDDARRSVDVIAQDSLHPRSDAYELHAGYLTGDEYPNTGKFVTQRVLYRARTEDNSIIFMTARTEEKGAALSALRVYEANGPLPAADVRPAEPIEGWNRNVGVYFEDIALGYDFGKSLGTPEDFETTVARLCEYMRFTGQNMLTYPIVWYHGRPAKEYAARPHIPEYFKAFLTIFDREKMEFMASVNQYRALFPTPPVSREGLESGKYGDSVFMIQADGQPGPIHSICLFHPDAQAMMNRYVDEILEEGAKHPSFKGISFHLLFNNLLTFGDIKYGYNDYLVEEFEKATGISIPVDRWAPDRGKLYADWLLENAQEEWIDWRCRKFAEFYRGLAEKLARVRPDLRLVLNCKIAIAYQRNFSLPNRYAGMRDYWEAANREMGIDAKYFKDCPNIVIEQTVFPADYRWCAGRLPNDVRETIRLTETRRGMYGTILSANMPWINMHDRYWESPVGDPNRNHVFTNHFHADWLVEHPWRVSTLNPTGFYAMRHYVMPLRFCDVQTFNKGGFLIGTLGMEDELRTFAKAFRTLPAVRFADAAGSTEEVKIRSWSDGKKTWFYVANTSEKNVEVALRCGNSDVTDLVQNQKFPVDANGKMKISIPPYRLKTFETDGNAPVAVDYVKDAVFRED